MYYFCFKLLCLLIILFNFGNAEVDIEELKKNKPPFIFKKFENCAGGSNYPLQFNDFNMDQSDKNSFVMNGVIENREDLGPELIGTVTANHCKDVNNPDSCEYLMQDYEFGDVCEMISDESGEWNYMLDHLKLPHKCPIPAGTYKIKNMKSINVFDKKLPVPEGLWKVELKCSVNDVVKGCAYLEVLL